MVGSADRARSQLPSGSSVPRFSENVRKGSEPRSVRLHSAGMSVLFTSVSVASVRQPRWTRPKSTLACAKLRTGPDTFA